MRLADKPSSQLATMILRKGSHWLPPEIGASPVAGAAVRSSDPVGALVLFESHDPVGACSPEAGGAVVLFGGVRCKCLRTAPRETPRVSAIRRSE